MSVEIVVEDCGKRYGDRIALPRTTLAVAAGEAVALTGPNGSGKSTLLRLIAGLTRPTVGSVTVAGVEPVSLPRRERGRIGYVAHRPLAYGSLTAAENLHLFAALGRVARPEVDRLLGEVGLAGRGGDRVETLSRGQQQRLSLARALMPAPLLLILDEPSTALDADGRALVHGLLNDLRGRVTIVIATHDPDEARAVCDRVVDLEAAT